MAEFNDNEIEFRDNYSGITQADLHRLFSIAEDGQTLINKRGRGQERKGEKLHTEISYSGYQRFTLRNKTLLLHKIIYLFHTGQVPVYLKHLDGNKYNNSQNNLIPTSLNDHPDVEMYLKLRARDQQP